MSSNVKNLDFMFVRFSNSAIPSTSLKTLSKLCREDLEAYVRIRCVPPIDSALLFLKKTLRLV